MGLVCFAILFSCPCQAAPKPKESVDIPALIERLVEAPECDLNSFDLEARCVFSPVDFEKKFHTRLLTPKFLAVRPDVFRQLVKPGIAALPHLIAHLEDQRPTKIPFEGTDLADLDVKIDRNPWTDKPITGWKPTPGSQMKGNFVLVGDLCYMAICKIVNRTYHARDKNYWAYCYSPVRSPALRDQIKKTWGSLTQEGHQAALIADFLKPDSEERRIGACKRLAYYYPEALEPLALQFLARPTYSAWDVKRFVQKEIYRETDSKRCQSLFDSYLAQHGEACRNGILLQLFEDLETLEAVERKIRNPPWDHFGDRPRKLLIQLYGWPKTVKSQDRPWIDAFSSNEKVHLIEEGLVFDRSQKIDRAVLDLLVSSRNDFYLARACIKRLVGRGHDAEIEAYCRNRLPDLLDKIGWTPLHVAVDRNDIDQARGLLQEGAKPSAPARNGQGPLHLAAEAGNLEMVRLLIEAGADLNPKDRNGLTPVQLAVQNEFLDVVRFLTKQGCTVPDVIVATVAGRTDLVRLFFTKGKAAPACTKTGQTLLHLAVLCGDVEMVKVLAALGCDLGAANKDSLKPLDVATILGKVEVAKTLLDLGSNMKGETTPLHWAAFSGQLAIIDLLLKKGASLDAKDKDAKTPFQWAFSNDQGKAAQRLFEAQAANRSGVDWIADELKNGFGEYGCYIIRNEQAPGKPMVGMRLSFGMVQDWVVQQLAELTELHFLSFFYTRLTGQEAKFLKKLNGLKELEYVDSDVNDSGLKVIAQLDQLESLRLSGTKISDAGLKELIRLQHLKQLDLDRTKVTGMGLGDLAGLKRLTRLNLNNSPVTDQGLKGVANLKFLRELDLGETRITDFGLKELAQLQQLQSLDLSGTKITDRGLAELQKALPKAKISR